MYENSIFPSPLGYYNEISNKVHGYSSSMEVLFCKKKSLLHEVLTEAQD